MTSDGPDGATGARDDVETARVLASSAADHLRRSASFAAMAPTRQRQILSHLARVQDALEPDPYAFSLADGRRRNPLPGFSGPRDGDPEPPQSEPLTEPTRRTPPATEAIAGRAGALLDEIDFPSFVAGLVHGTFDAVVDASIRQLEAFADLVSSVAKTADQFTSENVTENQARDWLLDRFPGDLRLVVPADGAPRPRLEPRRASRAETGPFAEADDEPTSPAWLAEFDLEGEELTSELVETVLVPRAARRLGADRLQTLATMVLLGMNRVVVRDGSISAKLRFRAAAQDRAVVDFAVGQDPQRSSWGARGSAVYSNHTTMVSTVGVNAQTDAQLRADLFGEVRLNFASETLPLDQFADAAQRALLQRNARWSPSPEPAPAPLPAPAAELPPARLDDAAGGGA